MSADSPSPLAIEEYRALRATIRERGSRRFLSLAITFVAWAARSSSIQVFARRRPGLPAAAARPGRRFRVRLRDLHVGVERVGRFLQVSLRTRGALPRGSTTAMAPNLRRRASRIDPLSVGCSLAAAFLNLAAFRRVAPPVAGRANEVRPLGRFGRRRRLTPLLGGSSSLRGASPRASALATCQFFQALRGRGRPIDPIDWRQESKNRVRRDTRH